MDQVISEKQRALNKALHQNSQDYGNRADGAGVASELPVAVQRMHELGVCNSLLDYGTGKGKLVEHLRATLPQSIHVDGYDPAVTQWDTLPTTSYDIVTCLDVLEHIEMSSIDAVLKDIHRLTKRFCYVVVDLQPAVKKLADGRNAHILLAPCEWWVARFAQLFKCQASFPIMHSSGIPQKIVIAATDNTLILPQLYGFLIKMKLFDFAMVGGPLGSGPKAKKAKQSK